MNVMKTRPIIAGAIAIFLLIGLIGKKVTESKDLDPRNTKSSRDVISENYSPSSDNLKRVDDESYLDSLSKISTQEIERFVNKKGRSVNSVAIATLLTYEWTYLDELKSYSDSAMALEILSTISMQTAEERLLWAEKLLEKSPGNGYAHLLVSKARCEVGDYSESIKSLSSALEQENLSSFRSELSPEFLELALGMENRDSQARLIFVEGPKLNALATANLLPRELRDMMAQLSQEDAIQATESYISAFERLADGSSLEVVKPTGYNGVENLDLELKRASVLAELARSHGASVAQLVSPDHPGLVERLMGEADKRNDFFSFSRSEALSLLNEYESK